MKHSPKARASTVSDPLREAAAACELRASFPDWFDDEPAAGLAPTVVTPRVRDSLVLRLVAPRKFHPLRHTSYAHGAR